MKNRLTKKSFGPRPAVTYAFWEHSKSGDTYESHPIYEIDKYLAREKANGRNFSVLLLEAADLHHLKARKITKILRKKTREARGAYLQALERARKTRVDNAEDFAAQQVYSSPSIWPPEIPISKAIIGQVVLAAKYALKIHALESYSKTELAKIREEITTFLTVSPELTRSLSRSINDRNLNEARKIVEKWAEGIGRNHLMRHKRMLEVIARVAKQVSRKAGHHRVDFIAPIGSNHQTILTLHKKELHQVEPRSFSSASAKEYFKAKSFPIFVIKAAGGIATGNGLRNHWLDRATLLGAVDQDIRAYRARVEVRARSIAQILGLKTGDFGKIAQAYRASNKPMHQVLEGYFAKK